MNFDTLHDHIGQNVHLGRFEGPRTWSKLIYFTFHIFTKKKIY